MNTYFNEVKKNFGFGCMRLPMNSEEVDYELTSKMVDYFIQQGFNYFDTAHGYLGGKSEIALKECLTSRYPRNQYILTNKLSTHHFNKQEEIFPLFESQLEACGVDYFDFYLMYAQSDEIYAKYKKLHAYDEASKLKEEGKIKHFEISFHDNADVLDMILTENPDIEVVQIQFNYVDYEDPAIQRKACYEVCRKHNKPVIVMEPVKGGMLANPPKNSNLTADASLALRFCGELDGVLAILSEMSNLTQVKQNIESMKDFQPLSNEEKAYIEKLTVAYKQGGPLGNIDFNQYKDVKPHGISLASLLETYNSCMI